MQFRKKTYYNNFEDFLQNEAEGFAAYPCDRIWNNIRTELHPQKRWAALSIVFFLLITAACITSLMFYPKNGGRQFAVNKNEINKKQNTLSSLAKNTEANNNVATNNTINYTKPIAGTNSNINDLQTFKRISILNKLNTAFKSEELSNNIENNVAEKTTLNTKYVDENVVVNNETNISSEANQPLLTAKLPVLATKEKIINDVTPVIKTPFKKEHKSSRWNIMFYATPSASYRVLDDNYLHNLIQGDKHNINDIVYQKASMGTELGVGFMYALSKSFFVKTGLQFNMRKYEAFAAQKSGVAQVSLVEHNQVTTSCFMADYTTQPVNNNSVTLNNTMYELCVPIGLQWQVLNGQRWGLIAAASVQPTFSLNKTIYAVSTDYKYYVEGTQFARKSNVNTSLELLLSLKAGKEGKVFFGPQIRYQQMSTFKDAYPIKENRIDYGIKTGFMMNL